MRSWVDDVGQRTEGSAKWCIKALRKAGGIFLAKATEAELKVASKSTIISSSSAVAKEIQKSFSKRGVNLQIQDTAPDLGIDRDRVAIRRPKASAGSNLKQISP